MKALEKSDGKMHNESKTTMKAKLTKKRESISKFVRTREVLIYDKSDRLRISLNANCDPEPKIAIYKEDGTPAIEISSVESDSDSRRIILYGNKRNFRLWLGSTTHGVGMTVYDYNGKFLRTVDLGGNGSKRKVIRPRKKL
jgi:hypothetical protein